MLWCEVPLLLWCIAVTTLIRPATDGTETPPGTRRGVHSVWSQSRLHSNEAIGTCLTAANSLRVRKASRHRLDEARRIIAEYVTDLREIIQKLRNKMN